MAPITTEGRWMNIWGLVFYLRPCGCTRIIMIWVACAATRAWYLCLSCCQDLCIGILSCCSWGVFFLMSRDCITLGDHRKHIGWNQKDMLSWCHPSLAIFDSWSHPLLYMQESWSQHLWESWPKWHGCRQSGSTLLLIVAVPAAWNDQVSYHQIHILGLGLDHLSI